MAEHKSEELQRKEMTRMIWGNINFLRTNSKEWGFVLLHPDFDHEPELRNRAFAIWAYSLAENAVESASRLSVLRNQAQKINARIALYYLDIIEKLHAGVADVLSPLTFEDMIILRRHRDEAVHGRVHATQKRIFYSDGQAVRVKKITAEEMSEVCSARWKKEGWEPQLLAARIAVLSKPSLFWFLHDGLMPHFVMDRVMSDLGKWDNSIKPGVLIEFIDNSYLATQGAFQESLRTFWFNRNGTATVRDRRLDPALQKFASLDSGPKFSP